LTRDCKVFGLAGKGLKNGSGPALQRYFSVMEQEGRNPGNLCFEMENLFGHLSFKGRSVLDIGAGDGHVSLYAASAGATRVVALEPESAGSHADVRTTFERLADRLGMGQVVLRGETLQEFEPGGEHFDVLISKASINHLDEEKCSALHRDPDAWRAYREILSKLRKVANHDAHLIVGDCSRYNLFAQLGVRNPLVPVIEWEKHQPPKLWAALLEEVGFRAPDIRWTNFNTLRRPGQLLLGNRVGAYLTASTFCLTMRRA
jgi:SAM-dependent methyltransferase